MNLIADTNVWYDIAAGRRIPAKLKSGGHTLHATPISFFEIVSLIDERNWEERRSACQAVLDHADSILVDSETHLASLCGQSTVNLKFDWSDGFKATAQATSKTELESGVQNFTEGLVRKVNIPFLAAWRGYQWKDFEQKIIGVVDQYVAGYKDARLKNRMKQANATERADLAAIIQSADIQDGIYKTIFVRALLVGNQPNREPTPAELSTVKKQLQPYALAYLEYLARCATFAPQSNDLGDHECFMYLQDDMRFLSSDKRWIDIAKTVCPHFYLDPENS